MVDIFVVVFRRENIFLLFIIHVVQVMMFSHWVVLLVAMVAVSKLGEFVLLVRTTSTLVRMLNTMSLMIKELVSLVLEMILWIVTMNWLVK